MCTVRCGGKQIFMCCLVLMLFFFFSSYAYPLSFLKIHSRNVEIRQRKSIQVQYSITRSGRQCSEASWEKSAGVHKFVVMLMHVSSSYAQNSSERLRFTSVSVTAGALGFGSPFELSDVFYTCTSLEIFPLTWFLSCAHQCYWFIETSKLSVSITIWWLFFDYLKIVKL